ncbi:hypothetical protein PA598K_03392, partial [Paenibacillus sp. 598K]
MKEQTASRWFDMTTIVILTITTLLCLAPFVHLVAISLSSAGPITSGKVSLFPVDFTLEAYAKVFSDASMIRSMFFTIGLTLLFTASCMLMTIALGYPLSRKKLKGRKMMMLVVVITMFFSGG